jgi:sialate O-acetylesterase
MMKNKLLTAIAAIFITATMVMAEVSLPSFFSNEMVLQRDIACPVWGWANPGEKVTVEFGNQKKTATADDSGCWMVRLDKMKASSEGENLTVSGIEITNVLVGDVWICSGQSNMHWGFRGKAKNYRNDNIRMFIVPQCRVASVPKKDVQGTWTSLRDGKGRDFSGVGLHFGWNLQKEIGVPVGLIKASLFGSPIEPFIADEGYELIGQALPKGGKSKNGTYNAMIAPLTPFGIKGAIWYQGEHNRGSDDYFTKLKGLIEGWRKVFEVPNFPFYIVQIAPCDRNKGDREKDDTVICNTVWRAQFQAAREIKNCGVIPTHDTIDGNVKNIHPTGKQYVGERLAAMAINKTYGKDVVCSGPVFKSAQAQGGKVIVSFDKIDQGLETEDGKAPTWFELSADGETFEAAEAAIDGKNVVVSSSKVSASTFVRMGWSEIAIPTLRDKNGWPVFQFPAMAVE